MAFGVLTNVVLYDQTMYKPGALVWVWVGRVTRRFSREAKKAAPIRSGELKAGIRATTPRSGYKIVRGFIRSDAPHTLAVIKGTHGPIMSNAAWASGGPKYVMVVTPSGKMVPRPLPGHTMAVGRRPWPPVTPRGVVSGQSANNFMAVAWRRTARAHPAIRGVAMPGALGG